MPSIKELQAQLTEKIAKLDAERQENIKRSKEEREKMMLEIEVERKTRLAAYEAKVAEHEQARLAKEKAEEERRQAEVADRIVTEQKNSALDEALRLQREKLKWLEKAIAEAEFAEEQHKKALENEVVIPSVFTTEDDEISKEYPQTCTDGGESTKGTEGNTPENPLMSTHLKQILRQATRQY